MQLRAVIFDYGEVISHPANAAAHGRLLEIARVPRETFDRCYWAHRLDYDAGILNSRTYWERVASDAGTEPFSLAQIDQMNVEDARMWMDINEPVLAWACQLKQSRQLLGILSNMGDGVLRSMRERFSWLGQFNVQVWSHELGVVKPDPAIYRQTISRLGIAPEEGLFIDNLEENVEGARAVGLQSVLFKDLDQLREDLRRLNSNLPLPRGASAMK